MEWLLDIISILAFFMSLITWISNYLSHRVIMSFEIKDHAKRQNVVQLYLYIQNDSDSPITISGISILNDSQKHPCEYFPKIIREHNHEVIIQTPYFPLNFAAHQAACFAFEFLACQDIELVPGKTLDLEIYTNRKILSKSLVLPPEDNILHFHK